MTTSPPALVGAPLADVETPALLIDLDAFERNLAHLARAAKDFGVRLRPHAKTHKCAVIARRQMALGAVGVCCQKVGEAEAMVYGGVDDVLISNQIVGAGKLMRLAALARQARIAVCVDNSANIAAIEQAAQQAGARIDVLVEIDVGANRCGVPPGQAALPLAQQIAASKHLHFRGLQAYKGNAQHIRSYEERKAAIGQAVEQARETRDLLGQHGLDCELISGAGTGTFPFEAASGVYNELQAGSYIFMDADYGRNLNQDGGFFDEFENSLFVYATVMSRPTEERAVLDAGLKALSVDSGLPEVRDLHGVHYVGPSDEHGVLKVEAGSNQLHLGDKIKLVPGHCDPTVNLYDWYVGIRNDRVESLWPVSARGAGT